MTPATSLSISRHELRAGMVGLGMIFDETYRPFFEHNGRAGLFDPEFGVCDVRLAAVASRTGRRAEALQAAAGSTLGRFASFREPDSVAQLLAAAVDFVCVATPDDRHFAAAKAALAAGKHVLIEKPSVLSLAELDELEGLCEKMASWPKSSKQNRTKRRGDDELLPRLKSPPIRSLQPLLLGPWGPPMISGFGRSTGLTGDRGTSFK